MEVKLRYTMSAEMAMNILLYTKETRLTQGQETWDKIVAMPSLEKITGLDYMSRSIPSSWEFVDYIFEIKGVSRGFTHQFVRTRTGSYAQQSLRVVDAGTFDYIAGPSLKDDALRYYQNTMALLQNAYALLLEKGAEIEDARGILPTNIATNIIAKFNLRTLAEMSRKRVGGRVQKEYRDVLAAMQAAVLDVHPWADKFLFPRGHTFAAVEKFIAMFRSQEPKLATEALKDIDLARQEIG